MKSYWLFVALAGLIGTGAAWMVNNQRYGSKPFQFGKFSSVNDVTADNVIELVKSEQLQAGGAVVEMLTPEFHDFGLMSMGERGKKTFRIKNVGTEPMTLKQGRSTCKCTIGKLNNTELLPGEETDINVEWTVKADSSEFEQRAQVLTNDPNKIAIDLRIFGKILRKLEFDPAKASFGDVAAGDSFEVSTNLYSYFDTDIEPVDAIFMSQQMNDLADFEIEPIEPEGRFEKARQAFRIVGKVDAGMRQGAVSTNLKFTFKQKQDDGKFLTDEETGEDVILRTDSEVSGRIIGSLSMIIGSKLKSFQSGGYLYDFGKLSLDSKLTAKTLIVLKGSEKDNTKLSIGEVTPAGVLKATLQEPKGRGKTMLIPLVLEIVPQDKPYDMTGKNRQDYGRVWIESDNPKVPRMLVGVKFAIEAKE